MSAQSVSDMIRNRVNVVTFLINNDGYTIERYIHGMKAKHNWVQPWRYLESPWYFGAPRDDPSYPVFTRRVTTWGELGEVLEDRQLRAGKGFKDVEDAPSSLKNLVLMVQKRNAGRRGGGPRRRWKRGFRLLHRLVFKEQSSRYRDGAHNIEK